MGAVITLECSVYDIETDQGEADGTLAWTSTVAVVVQACSDGAVGTGWTYAAGACKPVVDGFLARSVAQSDPMDVPAAHESMVRACRNLGRPGVVGCAISAVDIALWDLKARLLDVPLSALIGRCRRDVPVYGSGGFTTYSDATTRSQLQRWAAMGIPRVKIKVGESWGSKPARDLSRLALARRTVGESTELYVDANGAYSRKQAVRMGKRFAEEHGAVWFEEPVSSDDLQGLREVRDQVPLDVTAGEYGYDETYFGRLLEAGAVDCVQIDVTRCGGVTSWLRIAAIAAANGLEVSGHCAPGLHAHVALCVPNLRHVELFHDHERVEAMLFTGTLSPEGGVLRPTDHPGHGYTLSGPAEATAVKRVA